MRQNHRFYVNRGKSCQAESRGAVPARPPGTAKNNQAGFEEVILTVWEGIPAGQAGWLFMYAAASNQYPSSHTWRLP